MSIVNVSRWLVVSIILLVLSAGIGIAQTEPNEFGEVRVGDSVDIKITATYNDNGANEVGQIQSYQITGPNADEFRLTSGTFPATLSDGQIWTGIVTFSPTSEGQKSATLTLVGSPNSVSFELGGTAISEAAIDPLLATGLAILTAIAIAAAIVIFLPESAAAAFIMSVVAAIEAGLAALGSTAIAIAAGVGRFALPARQFAIRKLGDGSKWVVNNAPKVGGWVKKAGEALKKARKWLDELDEQDTEIARERRRLENEKDLLDKGMMPPYNRGKMPPSSGGRK